MAVTLIKYNIRQATIEGWLLKKFGSQHDDRNREKWKVEVSAKSCFLLR
jgi:hypothetical protein